MTDIEIAHKCALKSISEIAAAAGIGEAYVEPYGRHKAKISLDLLREKAAAPDGKLILVTAITPTPAGEGKTTTSIGLTDALRRCGKNALAALREPSLGPVFGIKGGATGGGYAQIVPMEDINLHFTGDFHAIGAANNLLAALLDNHIQQGNALGIDPKQITWKRCVDMNDRQLRHVSAERRTAARARTGLTSPWRARSWRCSVLRRAFRISRRALGASSWDIRTTARPSRRTISRPRAR